MRFVPILAAAAAAVAWVPAAVPASYPVTCVGRADAPHQAVFLHGMRPTTTSAASAGHVAQLTKMATALGYRIAIPMSTTRCENSAKIFCWRGDPKGGPQETWNAVLASASKCFKSQDVGLIGFSNGGYYAAKVVLRNLQPAPRWAIAIGSAGTVTPELARQDLSGRPPLYLLIGTKDVTRRATKAFFERLAPTTLPVTLKSYEGYHEVPFPLVTELVKSLDEKAVAH